MTNFDDRRKTRRAVNAYLTQYRENKPDWLFRKQGENEISTLIIDLGLHGCSLILPRDCQITATELTLSMQEVDDKTSLQATIPFKLVWIDEHFSNTEQKFGLQFNEPDAATNRAIQACMTRLEGDKAGSVRCLVKVKEEMAFLIP